MQQEKYKRLCDEILAEIGEKFVIIRHDIDNIYAIYRSNKLLSTILKAVNYSLLLVISYAHKIRYIIPYYEIHISEVVELEKAYGATATFFVRPITIPRRKLVRKLKANGHEIAYHSDRNYNFDVWYSDLKFIERETSTVIKGFTKHGISPVRGDSSWNEERLIEYGSSAKLKYFAQGEGHPDWIVPRKIKGIWVFGHHVTIERVNDRMLVNYLNSQCAPMILMHPEYIGLKSIRSRFENVITSRRGISVIKFISVLEKLVQT